MRLTLRTLLSYLDDTLEPSQAKLIGAKVAESDQARELMNRIKQVTRRRRLTSPATSGPGGIDPNTIAEYLDNEVSPDKASEVEQICLASDVHLAEVAACHQILTLVLGEPALVPPTARQRMYGLVRGAASYRAGKPKATAKPDMDLSSSEIEPDQDETLRLGVPSISRANSRNFWMLIGGGVLAACLLGVAVLQLLRERGPRILEPKGDPDAVALVKPAEKEKPKEKTEIDTKVVDPMSIPVIPVTPPKESANLPVIPIQVVPVPVDPIIPETVLTPASLKQMPVGQYLTPHIKEPSVLLQMKADNKAGWVRVGGKNPQVFSARPLMSLSGSKSVVILQSGIELTLWGNLPEVTLDPLHLESRVILHVNEQGDTDLTLQRGRVVLKNLVAKDAFVRLRFDNPLLVEENHFDIVLQGKGASVAVERYSVLDWNEPFYENPKDPDRKGPAAMMQCYALAKSANIRSGQVAYNLDTTQQPVLLWMSSTGGLEPPAKGYVPPLWIKGVPPLKEEGEQIARQNAIRAHQSLAQLLETRMIEVGLREYLTTIQEEAKTDFIMDKRLSRETFAKWRHAIRCLASLDNAGFLFEEFASDNTPAMMRFLYMQTLHAWLGLQRSHDYDLLKVINNNHSKTASIKIMELFHKVSVEDARKPVKYQQLIEGLNNNLLPIRALSYWHLSMMAPAGNNIPYDAAAPPQIREAAVRAWTQLIPPGQLPPSGPPLKKDKK